MQLMDRLGTSLLLLDADNRRREIELSAEVFQLRNLFDPAAIRTRASRVTSATSDHRLLLVMRLMGMIRVVINASITSPAAVVASASPTPAVIIVMVSMVVSS